MTTAPATRSDQTVEAEPLPPLLPSFESDDASAPHCPISSLGVIDRPDIEPLGFAATAVKEPAGIARDVAWNGQTERKPWAPWRVRLTYVVAFVIVGVPIAALMSWLWVTSDPAHGSAAKVVDALSFVWILLAIPVLLNVVGALTFRDGSTKREDTETIGNLVCFRIVTRGTNVQAVTKSVNAVRVEMARTPLFPYCVEVVTDKELPFSTRDEVTVVLVPTDYQTPAGSRFKARALHYALQVSPIPDATWLFHLDEETHITPSVIRGIRSAIIEEEESGKLRIGQGVVLYHRDLPKHPFLTLADSVRTGDDLGRFRLQHRFGQTAFGMHGSYILVRNDVEKEVGFDLGPSGSITEDAWWSLAEMANGRRSRWVDGYCLEQSTRSVMDFIKQRRRWFVGLILVCFRAPALFWHRVALVSSVVLWGVGWLGWWTISIAVVVFNVRVPLVVYLVGTVSLVAYSALYLLGLELNLEQRGVPWYRRIPWYFAQILFLPLFSLLEGSAVVLGAVRPDFNFHVVKK